jgi:prepilin-type N-terminal cleavage/methylation domain-containing protein
MNLRIAMNDRSLPFHRALRARPAGFTLIELLVVMTLLVLLLAMALPAFRYITGSRSVENARNIASAMLARTRVTALNTGRYVGVLFYVDPITQRSTMTTVAWKDPFLTQEDIDPLERYKSWQDTGSYYGQTTQAPTSPPSIPPVPDHAIALVRDDSVEVGGMPYAGYPGEGGKPLTFVFHRISVPPQPSAVALTGSNNGPPGTGGVAPTSIPPDTVMRTAVEGWEVLTQGNVDFPQFIDPSLVDVGETQTLPPGVGVQVAVDPEGSLTTDRYMRTGLILFDPSGRVDVRVFGIKASSALGTAMGLGSDIRMNTNPQPRSGLGLAFYDQETFVNQGYSDDDLLISLPHLSDITDETGEETWIDDNASVSLINRSAGTLIGGE